MKIFAILLLAFSPAAMAATPWETYLDLPKPQNASRVPKIAYSEPRPDNYDSGDLEILQTQIGAQDSDAFRLGYRLYKSADGGLAEELGVILSKAIRSHPTFFLQQVSALGADCSGFRWVVNTPGLEYADRELAAAYEIRMRQVSLRSVKSKNLQRVRDRCLALIQPL
jgi:hypothetical protein